LIWTTCRYASAQTREAAKRLARLSGSRYVSRGKKTLLELADLARRSGYDTICLVFQQKEKPFWVFPLEVKPFGDLKWGQKIQIDEYVKQRKV
jgi:rRNA maturation protein Rpf1